MIEQKSTVFKLSNGLRVVYMPTLSNVAHLGVTILGGSRFEQNHEEGLAHFLEHCIFKGTKKRRSLHILSRLDSVGGELNAFTSKEEICVYASFTNEHLTRSSELIADILLNASFPPKEIEKEKEIVLDELNSYLDSPSDRIFDDFEAQLFQDHPLGCNILGNKESVSSFTQEHLLAYVKRYFHVENMVISFVGNIKENHLRRVLERDFSALKATGELLKPKTFSNFQVVKRRANEANYQAHAIVGSLAPGFDSEERRGMTLLCNLLGGPALNSRLILSIREKYGYSYNIEANYTPYMDIGYWSIYFGTDQKYLDKTLKLVYKELKLIREQALSENQLKRAKEQLKGHLALSMDSNAGIMLGLGKSMLLFNQIDSIEEIYEGIDQLTTRELQEIAAHYFDQTLISELIYEVK